MALYKLLLNRLVISKNNFCHSHFLPLMNKETSLKQIKLSNHKVQFTSSGVNCTKSGNVTPNVLQLLLEEQLKSLPKSSDSLSLVIKPFAFTVIFCGASFAGMAIWQYENMHAKATNLLKNNWITENFQMYEKKQFSWRNDLNRSWNSWSEDEKIFVPICFLNVIVFLAWHVKRFQPVMAKYFCSSPYKRNACWPMILSVFSHFSLFHLAGNMIALYSFTISGVEDLGKEQFLGLYLAGGVISSFTSYLYKIIKMHSEFSLGGSGALMAVLAYTCVRFPDSNISLIFLPSLPFSAGTGIKFIMGLDLIGVLKSWSYFDHAAHLGGACCGLAWYYWGNAYIWQKRERLLEWWHEFRTSK